MTFDIARERPLLCITPAELIELQIWWLSKGGTASMSCAAESNQASCLSDWALGVADKRQLLCVSSADLTANKRRESTTFWMSNCLASIDEKGIFGCLIADLVGFEKICQLQPSTCCCQNGRQSIKHSHFVWRASLALSLSALQNLMRAPGRELTIP